VEFLAFENSNARAREAARTGRVTSREVGECNRTLPYRGFIPCYAAEGQPSFVMFNNADDVVAAHYLYAGPASFEPETLRLWVHLARQSQWVYDVGAFTGVFSLAAVAANPYCCVMAFEPSGTTYSRLLVNIQANDFTGRIAPVRCGLARENGTLSLRHPCGVYVMSSDESFVAERVEEPWFSEPVAVMSLDSLLAEQERYRQQIVLAVEFTGADLIKIDVEGFELDVLAGMTQTLAAHRPSAIVELFDVAQIDALLAVLGAGYHAYLIDHLPYTPGGGNVLLIHETRLAQLDGFTGTPGLWRDLGRA